MEFADYENWDTMMAEMPDLEEEWQKEEVSLTPDELMLLGEEREWLQRCLDLAERISKNSKADQLLIALEKGFKQLSELGAQRKALIFTESRRTQEYLFRLLSESGYEGQVMTFSGTNNDGRSAAILRRWRDSNQDTGLVTGVKEADMRAALVDEFRHRASIMIATEAAAEGINLQFCSLVVNYDLPWNPQRIEQRIGRCHRYGQRHDVVVINFLNKSNAADRRVYELLDEKFSLFNGVFGASDEVLGSISSGTDFEQRIAHIYKTCRSEEEIQEAFDQLKAELSPEIDERMQQTRATLLEHFDDEVRARLRDSEGNSRRLLRCYEERLWMLTQYILRKQATFSSTDYSFILEKPIVGISDTGPYYMLETTAGSKRSEMEHEGGVLYRANHALAQYVISKAKDVEATPLDTLVLDYSQSGKRISPLKDFVGQEGYLSVDLFSIKTAETVDHLAVAMITEQGEKIPSELVEHIWSLPSRLELTDTAIPAAVTERLDQLKSEQVDQTTDRARQEALKLFDEQLEKLDTWAEDMKLGLDKEIKDLTQTIKLMKSEARKMDTIEARLVKEREIKTQDALLKRKRAELFAEHDRIEMKKDKLTDDLERLLRPSSEKKTLFSLRWRKEFTFSKRSKHPPKDEVNALLSFFYTLQTHDVRAALETVGLDAYVGFLHVDHPGRAELAIDLMEEMRAYLDDRFVLSIINKRQVERSDFIPQGEKGFLLKEAARKRLIGLWQKRKKDEITHPFLKEKMPLGLLPYIQALLLARHLRGDLDEYPVFLML